MKVTIIILKFLFLGALFIVSNQNLYLGQSLDRTEFVHSFYSWIDTLVQHAYQITGYVVDSEWLPSQNSSGPFE